MSRSSEIQILPDNNCKLVFGKVAKNKGFEETSGIVDFESGLPPNGP